MSRRPALPNDDRIWPGGINTPSGEVAQKIIEALTNQPSAFAIGVTSASRILLKLAEFDKRFGVLLWPQGSRGNPVRMPGTAVRLGLITDLNREVRRELVSKSGEINMVFNKVIGVQSCGPLMPWCKRVRYMPVPLYKFIVLDPQVIYAACGGRIDGCASREIIARFKQAFEEFIRTRSQDLDEFRRSDIAFEIFGDGGSVCVSKALIAMFYNWLGREPQYRLRILVGDPRENRTIALADFLSREAPVLIIENDVSLDVPDLVAILRAFTAPSFQMSGDVTNFITALRDAGGIYALEVRRVAVGLIRISEVKKSLFSILRERKDETHVPSLPPDFWNQVKAEVVNNLIELKHRGSILFATAGPWESFRDIEEVAHGAGLSRLFAGSNAHSLSWDPNNIFFYVGGVRKVENGAIDDNVTRGMELCLKTLKDLGLGGDGG